MFPISGTGEDDAMLNDRGMFAGNLSEEEIDVINADDDEVLEPGSGGDGDEDEEEFEHPEHVFMVNDEERDVFEDGAMRYDSYIEDGEVTQYPRVPVHQYEEGILENQELYNAHYLSFCDVYMIDRTEDALYNFFENPEFINSIRTAARLEMCSEQKMMPPLRRSSRRPYEQPPWQNRTHVAAVEQKLKKYSPEAAALLRSNGFYPSLSSEDREETSRMGSEPPTMEDHSSRGSSAVPMEKMQVAKPSQGVKPSRAGESALSRTSSIEKETPAAESVQTTPEAGQVQTKSKENREQKKRLKITLRKIYKAPLSQARHGFPKQKDKSNGLPLTPLPDRFFKKRDTITAEEAGFISDCVQCTVCNFIFRNVALLDTHMKKHERTGRKELYGKKAGLVCAYSECPLRCDSIATVVKHMKIAHSVTDILFERILFKNYGEFKMWKAELERLTMSRFSRTSGKKNIFSKSIYYQCHHSGITPDSTDKYVDTRKERSRQSKKLDQTCTAFFHIRVSNDGSVLLRGCTKHSGHGVDVRQLPLSQEIRMEIAHFLIKGHDENSIVDNMRLRSSPANRRYFLQTYEVRNVANKIDRFKEEYKRKLSTGEPLPDLAEVIRDARREREAVPTSRAMLACNQFPVVLDDEGYVRTIAPTVYNAYYEDRDHPMYEQVVVEEEGEFNVPVTSTVEAFTETDDEDGEVDVDVEKEPEEPSGPKPRKKIDKKRIVPLAIRTSKRTIIRRGRQKKPVAVIEEYHAEEEERLQEIEQDMDVPSTSSRSQPSRQSSRLQKKQRKRSIAEVLGSVEREGGPETEDNQLVGDDVDYVPGTD